MLWPSPNHPSLHRRCKWWPAPSSSSSPAVPAALGHPGLRSLYVPEGKKVEPLLVLEALVIF